jgi:hypothetical protein
MLVTARVGMCLGRQIPARVSIEFCLAAGAAEKDVPAFGAGTMRRRGVNFHSAHGIAKNTGCHAAKFRVWKAAALT